MPELPQALLHSLKDVEGFDEAAFKDVHHSGTQVTSIRINPAKWTTTAAMLEHAPFSAPQPVPWARSVFAPTTIFVVCQLVRPNGLLAWIPHLTINQALKKGEQPVLLQEGLQHPRTVAEEQIEPEAEFVCGRRAQ